MALVETIAMALAELLQNCRRLAHASLVPLQERHHICFPDARELVDPCPPMSRLLGLRRERARLPVVGASCAHAGRRRGCFYRFLLFHFQPQKLNLLVRDHRAPMVPALRPEPLGAESRTRLQHALGSANLIVAALQ